MAQKYRIIYYKSKIIKNYTKTAWCWPRAFSAKIMVESHDKNTLFISTNETITDS